MITLKTLAEATAQQVFDQVATHMLKQGTRSTSRGGCAYRGAGGMMCAAGCLIGDNEYNIATMDGNNDTSWVALVKTGVFPDTQHNALIRRLQVVHDDTPEYRWSKVLRDLADSNSLSTEVLEQTA